MDFDSFDTNKVNYIVVYVGRFLIGQTFAQTAGRQEIGLRRWQFEIEIHGRNEFIE